MSLPPSDSQPDLVILSNEEILEAIVECIRNNDKHTLKRWLKVWKIRPFPPPAIREKSPLHVAASKPEYKECLELLLDYIDSLPIDINDTLSFDRETALHIACRNGCDESVLLLLQKQCDVHIGSPGDDSALHVAALKGNLKIAQYLLDYGANIHELNCYRMTPLHKAAACNHLDVARLLLEKGAKAGSVNHNDDLPLHFACCESNYDMVGLLVKHDSSIINHQNVDGSTPVILASENSPNERIVRLLHENGATFRYRDCGGRLALHHAAKNSNVDILRYVLEHTDASSIEQWFEDIPNLLQNKKSVESLICCAIDSGNVECLEILLASNKLSARILQVPRMKKWICNSHYEIYSPLTLLFDDKMSFASEKFDLYLRLLFEHNLPILDEFFGAFETILPVDKNNLPNPFSNIIDSALPFSKQLYYINWLNTNGITIDYCLQCYHDNTQLFASFDDYSHYYKPVLEAILDSNVEELKLMMSTSAILEPDKLIVKLNGIKIGDNLPSAESISQCHVSRKILFDDFPYSLFDDFTDSREEHCNIYKYLISLKPIFHTHAQLHDSCAENNVWFPCYIPNAGQELAESTLKQLCRTTIRHHLRKDTLKANLRDFRRNILELPLPPSLKDYLLFKS